MTPTSDNTGQQDHISNSAALIAACDRICGVESNYHKDRCPLYKANCAAMDAMNGATFDRCVRCGKGKVPDSRAVCMFCRLEDAREFQKKPDSATNGNATFAEPTAPTSAAPIPPLTAKEIRAELQRLRRICSHFEKLSDPGKRWLVSRLSADLGEHPW